MKENYFGTINYQNNINVFNPDKNSFLSNNTFTNSTSIGASQNISNSNNSMGIEELPPMEEDIDLLKKFHLQNRNNIYHLNNLNTANNINEYQNKTRSYSVKNNILTNKLQPQRNTANFYVNKSNNLKPNYINQQNINVQKPPQRSLQSRYSSASENRYRFTHKLNLKPQLDIINTYRNLYGENYVKRYVALEGHSEHQTGLAFDVGSTSANVFANSDEYKWMLDNAHKYGFILRFSKKGETITGFREEPWHYRFVGKKTATYIYENNLTLEEYYAMVLDK
jgi:D-alanyl-D-alanine carboxypeptidase